MTTRYVSLGLLALLYIVFVTSLLLAIPLLPAQVASHFNAAGQPDGWMNRADHLGFLAGFGVAFPSFLMGVFWVTRYLPTNLINLPHRDYWLAEARRAESASYLAWHGVWFGCLAVAFVTGLHWLIVLANQRQPAQLPGPLFFGWLGAFLIGVAVWLIVLLRRFRAPDAAERSATTARAVLGLIALSLPAFSSAEDSAGEKPPVVAVEGQPLAANVARVVESLKSLGAPLPVELATKLNEAATAREAVRLQELLDARVLCVVHINPESRVKVTRGPARAELQQFGFTPVLVKVVNESTVTKRLRMLSPQSGAVYAGVAKLSMQRQQSFELTENENKGNSKDRFLSVAMHDQPPMLGKLSGLEVEYAIGLILSTEAGKREATIGFDLGEGEQDLGARGETAVLFTVKPAVNVRLSIRDHDGQPTTACLVFKDRLGRVYPPQAKRLAPDVFFQPQVYRADGESVLLPPGEFLVQSSRGPEYWVREHNLTVHADGSLHSSPHSPSAERLPSVNGTDEEAGTRRVPPKELPALPIQLERWVNPREHGFYSGDHHIHAAGCAHYTSPTEGVTPEDMFRQVKGEGLNVGCVLTWGPCYRHQRQYFAARPHDVSEPLTLLKYDLEISGFGSQALGHVCLLNLKDQTYPGSDGTETKGWPTWTTPVMKWAKAQGGVTGYAHSASGLWIEPPSAAKRFLARYDSDQNGLLSRDEAKPSLLPESTATFDQADSNRDGSLSLDELIASHLRAADQLPNLAIPEMNGVGAMEVCVSTAEGACDFISAMDTRRIQEWNTWYHVMNCGFPLKVSGETDFPCMSSRRVGQGRVYVKLAESAERGAGSGERKPTIPNESSSRSALRAPSSALDFASWCEGLARGRSYVSDGFAHALDFRVNGLAPGEGDVALGEKKAVAITATVCFAPETPETVAQGTAEPVGGGQRFQIGDTVELHGPRTERVIKGGERLIEIVVNGRVVASKKVPADGAVHELKFDVAIDHSSWVALRHFPQLHTNPVSVIVAGRPIRASRASARWCHEVIELLWQNRQKNISEPEREEARITFERAKAAYGRIADECEWE